MKICVININNCIDYSQYGEFLFEHIKNGSCVMYNSISDTGALGEIYDEILAEYNRNAFGEKDIRLLLIIPRDMTSPKERDYEIYHDINIYNHIVSKLNIFSEIYTLYVDDCHEPTKGEIHKHTVDVSEDKFARDESLGKYFPVCSGKERTKAEMAAAVEKISNPMFRGFYKKVLSIIPEDIGKEYEDQFMKAFSMFCAKILRKPCRIYQLIDKRDIADSIRKRLKIVYYIKHILESGKASDVDYESFHVDYEKVKVHMSTYSKRLSQWLRQPEHITADTVKRKKAFIKLHNAGAFIDKLNKMIDVQLADFENPDISEESVIDETFERFEIIVETADKAMEEFSKKDSDAYFDEANYFEESVDNKEDDDKLTEEYEKMLTKELNIYTNASIPGVLARERLLLMLKDARAKIEELFGCMRVYYFRTFIATLIFACLSVAVLYFLAQKSVLVKDNAIVIFCIYNAVVAALFFTVYQAMKLRYKREIKKIIRACKKLVEAFLNEYCCIAQDFEKNLNLMADIACLREYLDKKAAAEKECNIKRDKLEWHKRKTRLILDNISHFNDFVKDTLPESESEALTPADYENDAEHTWFYQVKIF